MRQRYGWAPRIGDHVQVDDTPDGPFAGSVGIITGFRNGAAFVNVGSLFVRSGDKEYEIPDFGAWCSLESLTFVARGEQ